MVQLSPSMLAGFLSRNPKFAEYLSQQHGFTAKAENFIRGYCDIGSRKELDVDAVARRKFFELRNDFDAWRGVIAAPR